MRIHAPIDNATSTACFRNTLLFPTREAFLVPAQVNLTAGIRNVPALTAINMPLLQP
jgi:hypothetical protein